MRVLYPRTAGSFSPSFSRTPEETRPQPDLFTMIPSARSRVAAIVGAKFRQKNISSVYDYDSGQYRNTSVRLSGRRIQGYDYGSSTHFSGSDRDDNLSFYDYQTGNHVNLKLNGRKFSGFDYHTGQHFSGTISGSSVSLYDYQDGTYHNFSV